MPKIIIAEDERILRDVLRDRFKDNGWDVITAEDGEQAFNLISKESPDLILLDLMMPKKTGLEVIKEIKNNNSLKSIPIMVLSNLGGDEDIQKATEYGVKDYFIKTQHPVAEILEKAKSYMSGT